MQSFCYFLCACHFLFQVTVKYGGIERSRVVHDEVWKAVVKQILNNKQASMRTLAKDTKCRDGMLEVVQKKIASEMNELCKHRRAVLKVIDNKSLTTFSIDECAKSLEETAPYLYQLMNSTGKRKQRVVTAISVLLYGHSQKLSLLQYITGLSLDRCGVSKEVMLYFIAILNF